MSGPAKPIWNPQTMSPYATPKSAKAPAAAVANHGCTPARRMTTRSSTAMVRWVAMLRAMYGR